MPLAIFPTSPAPANMERTPSWGETVSVFDSGMHQGSTPYSKPLYTFGMTFTNMPRSRQSSLSAFYNNVVKGKITPFLFQDPYDFDASSGTVVTTGTSPTSFFLKTIHGYQVFAKSGSLLITSALSGNLTQNSHYVLNTDNGIIVASMRPTSSDFWTVRSGEFYKKCVFVSYSESSPMWNQFSGSIQIQEIALG